MIHYNPVNKLPLHVHALIDQFYDFDVDKTLEEYKFQLPKGFYIDGIYRGADIFIQVSCPRKPTSRQLKRVKEIILGGLQWIHQECLANYIAQIKAEMEEEHASIRSPVTASFQSRSASGLTDRPAR